MSNWVTIVFIVLIAAVLASFFFGRGRMSAGPGTTAASGYESGTLTVTGVSGRGAADKNGVAYFTVSGTIIGPSTSPTEVYGTLTLDTGDADPYVGQEVPVIYKPGKAATTWRFGTLSV
ncbi:hypothetical protein GOHSU_04_02000 [Gordonia hirsuta DSM 44140 = NBRC 16056]|uniref:Uncharacterized protein n=1 Tax=Gordonia hirsuta DSM 44140 = NBRC 16056 TaxID=1121927 RepID=L7L5B6_9ACTN|nr:hypothetical protein [Gordonia hirsuta]GAC56330.1 hypothetical protein GOHSU_04_02000 [Gordonia hirsuta DSM 44140 = NBRC 16056]